MKHNALREGTRQSKVLITIFIIISNLIISRNSNIIIILIIIIRRIPTPATAGLVRMKRDKKERKIREKS